MTKEKIEAIKNSEFTFKFIKSKIIVKIRNSKNFLKLRKFYKTYMLGEMENMNLILDKTDN